MTSLLTNTHPQRTPDSPLSAAAITLVVIHLLLATSLALAAQSAPPSPSAPDSPASSPPRAAPPLTAAALQQEAIETATRVAREFPGTALSEALLGSAHYNSGNTTLAEQHLRKCLQLEPRQADALDILARIAYEKGDLDEAITLGRQASAIAPSQPDLLSRLGRALLDSGLTDDAIATLERAVALPKAPAECRYLLGQACLQAGDFRSATNHFLQTLRLVPDHTQAAFGLFTACARLELPAETERFRAEFQRLEALDRQALTHRSTQQEALSGLPLVRQTVAQTLFGAAQLYRLHRRPDPAGLLLLRCAILDPDQPLYRAALESHYLQNNAVDQGIRAFQDLTRDQPDSAPNQLFLGRLLTHARQTNAAEQAFLRVQELVPDSATGYRALAEHLLRFNGDPARALTLARRAADLEPAAPNFQLLAVASLKAGDPLGARTAAARAAALHPDDPKYREFLRKIEAASATPATSP